MRSDVITELKELRLRGMVGAWEDLTAQGDPGIASSKWLIEHLLQAEHTHRAMASVSHQMKAAKFPLHRDLAGFDFGSSKVDEDLVGRLATLEFSDTAQNVVLIGGPGMSPVPCRGLDEGQNALGNSHGGVGNRLSGKARAVLFHGRFGQPAGAGESAGQGGPDCAVADAHGRRYFG